MSFPPLKDKLPQKHIIKAIGWLLLYNRSLESAILIRF